MKAVQFMRQPFVVTGYQVTEEDMDAIAKWCEGHVIEREEDGRVIRFIRVPVERATNVRQTEGHVGTWVLVSPFRGRESYKVYTQDKLEKDFIPVPRKAETENDFIPSPRTEEKSQRSITPLIFKSKSNNY